MSGGLMSVYDEWCMMSDVNVRNTEVPSKLPLTTIVYILLKHLKIYSLKQSWLR